MIVLFMKARDKRDTLTGDLFGDGQMALFVKPTPIKSYTDKNGRVVPAHTANIKHSTDQKVVATSSKMLHSEAVETKQQERKMEQIKIADRDTSAGKLVVTCNHAGRGIEVILGGKRVADDAILGPARGIPKQYVGTYTKMLVTSKGNVLLKPTEAALINEARASYGDGLVAAASAAEYAALNSDDPNIRRAALVIKERDTYSPENFPGSSRWLENKKWADQIAEIDRDHPEISEKLNADRKARDKAKYDALSDFVKMGS